MQFYLFEVVDVLSDSVAHQVRQMLSPDNTPGFISKRYITEFVMDIHAATRYI